MANSISQLQLPSQLSQIPNCLISQLILPLTHNQKPITKNCNLNPHFFAYSQFPLYLSFFSDQSVHIISSIFGNLRVVKTNLNNNEMLFTTFPAAIFWLRFWSAFSSTLTVYFVYLISKKLLTTYYSLLAAVFATFTPGLIQSAHFGTTESLLTMLFLASIYFSVNLYEENTRNLKFNFRKSLKIIIWLGLSIGLALGSKLTGIFFLFPPLMALILSCNQLNLKSLPLLRKLISQGILILVFTLIITILASPYNLVAWNDFVGAVFGYEKDVATGFYPAFYTTQFVDTTPVIFQVQKVFPYVLGWPIFVIGSIGILLSTLKLFIHVIIFIIQKILSQRLIRLWRKSSKFPARRCCASGVAGGKVQKLRKKLYLDFGNLGLIWILVLGFWIYFIPNAFLYAKWTRFMTPIFPFFSIFAGYFLFQIYNVYSKHNAIDQKSKIKNQSLTKNSKLLTINLVFILSLLAFTLLPGAAFISIYSHPDSRLQASYWIYDHLPDNSYVLSETANVVDIPLGIPDDNKFRKNYTVISFDFYHLDENPLIFKRLLSDLERADYIFIPSRRLFTNYTRLSNKYPLLNRYYQLLFSGALGFTKVAEFNSFPKLEIGPPVGGWKLEFNDELSEETYTVFDHPVVRIYKKTRPMTTYEYEYLLKS
ncbi:phospholipid carrier-dependent glycosyltransferase [Candidatus Gottesmanbacteria bacterium]|nr:phospholipid carrier-dependent glycosyltransferase [Candidatus Gottesmanbacteria bacterium]